MIASHEPSVRDWPWVLNFLLTTAVTTVCVLPYVVTGSTELAVTSFLLCTALLVRRQFPRIAVAWAACAAMAQAVLTSQPTLSIVVVPMVIYAAARYTSRSSGLTALALGLVGAVVGPYRWAITEVGNAIGFAVSATACGAIVAGAYLLGRRLHDQRENVLQRQQSEAERARLRQAEAEQRARVQAVDERSRIARELHDIVAHSLSVIVVQAEGGRAVVLKKPEVAAEVLGTIAETGRDALTEMRQIVDLLRGGRRDDGYLPSPGLTDIPELVQRTGDRFTLVTSGAPPQVSAALGLTAYRIVQESLTNVLKHAGPAATARVGIAYTPTTVEIEVTDDGRGAASAYDVRGGRDHGPGGHGHGLTGMTERVAVLRGTLQTGPRPGGGFAVRASLPLGVSS